MKLWISFAQKKEPTRAPAGFGFKDPGVHVAEPEWIAHEDYIDDGYWKSEGEQGPCWSYLAAILEPGITLPRRPRELLELDVEVSEQWEMR